jgi:hypothetical protein
MNSNHILPYNKSCRLSSQHGFALVIALSLMAFVLLLLLSITTLVQVETTSANIAKTRLVAQQNALTGALTALGELQQHCGVDQRSTASAGITDSDSTSSDIDDVAHPQWMGVWRYDQGSQTKELETWLISGNQDKTRTTLLDPVAVLTQPGVRFPASPFANSVNDADYVEAPIVYMDADESDGFAYWVSGQQEKADVGIALPTDPLPSSIEGAEVLSGQYSLLALGFDSLDPSDPVLAKVSGLSQLPLINGVDTTQLEATAAALGAGNFGLLTNARDGGLRTDLTSKLETVAAGDTTAWVDFTAYGIPNDNYTTKSPTWGRLKAFYDLKDVFAVGGAGVLTPTPGTADIPGISPSIAMFSFGLAIGSDPGRGVEVLYQPMVVLHNPYNVPMAAHSYMLNYFGLAPRLASEGRTSDNRLRSGIAIAHFNYNYLWDNPDDGLNGGNIRQLKFNLTNGWIKGSDNVKDDVLRERAGEPSGLPSTASYPPGSPRFRVVSPEIGPGEAILFMPESSRTAFDRMSPANPSLTPGNKFTFFKYPISSNLKLLAANDPELTNVSPPTNEDFFKIHIWDNVVTADNVGYLDAILSVDESAPDTRGVDAHPIFLRPSDSGRMHTPQRKSEAYFSDRIYQMTGRIPHNFVDHYNPPLSTPVYYSDPHPVPPATANSVSWSAAAYSPLDPPPGMAYNPYKYFNPRAKIMERADLLTRAAGSRSEIDATIEPSPSYFYEPFVGQINDPDGVVLDTYGAQNEKVRIGGGLRNPVADTMILYDVPSDATGLYSLGQLQHFQMSDYFDEAGYAIGNSLQSPHINPDKMFEAGAGVVSWLDPNKDIEGLVDYTTIDLSYVLNDALWDRYFFSTTAQLTQGELDAGTPLPNPRLQPLEGATLAELQQRADPDPDVNTAAANLLVKGAFNVNSTSVDAWKALLAGNHNRFSGVGGGTPLESPFFRFFSNDLSKQGDPWAGFSEVRTTVADPPVDTQLQLLAEAIVEQVKLRGPFRSLAEFVNRRLEDSALGTSGALQAAIDQSGINDEIDQDAVEIDVDEIPFAHPEHLTGKTADGIAGSLSQADILTAIGPYLTTRSDTFTITSYGEHSNPMSGDTVRALLEMTVQRMPDYVDSAVLATVHPDDSGAVNQAFGRRFVVVGTRWLDASSLN